MDESLAQFVTDDLKADPVAWPILEKMPEKSVTEVLKSYAHSQHRFGSAIPVPNGNSKPEDWQKWETDTNAKLKERGYVVTKPDQLRQPAPESYASLKPEGLPEGAWNDGTQEKVFTVLKKHGATQELINDLAPVYFEHVAELLAGDFGDPAAAEAELMQWLQQRNTEAATKGGKPIDANQLSEGIKRWSAENIKNERLQKKLVHSGLANDPDIARFIYTLAEGSGMFDTRDDQGSGVDVVADAQNEINAIRYNAEHPKHAKFIAGDKEVAAYVEALYKKLPTDGRPGPMD